MDVVVRCIPAAQAVNIRGVVMLDCQQRTAIEIIESVQRRAALSNLCMKRQQIRQTDSIDVTYLLQCILRFGLRCKGGIATQRLFSLCRYHRQRNSFLHRVTLNGHHSLHELRLFALLFLHLGEFDFLHRFCRLGCYGKGSRNENNLLKLQPAGSQIRVSLQDCLLRNAEVLAYPVQTYTLFYRVAVVNLAVYRIHRIR